MRNRAWVVAVVAVLGCSNSPVGPGSGGSGGHGGLAGAGGAVDGSAGAAGGGAGSGGLAGAGGAADGSAGVAGGGAGSGGQSGPTCLQDLWAACGLVGSCKRDDLNHTSCFDSGVFYATPSAVSPPCTAPDGGGNYNESVVRLFTVKKPDGSTCFMLSAEYSEPLGLLLGGPCDWEVINYTWTDATGATVATGRAYDNPVDGIGSVSLTCTNGGAQSCNTMVDPPVPPAPCPQLDPSCYGSHGTCLSPADAGAD
jgi:hypothetical protein